MSDLATLENELNQMILAGKTLEAFEKFYAEECVMQENNGEPCVGKDANREREIKALEGISEVHGGHLVASAIGDGVTFSEWSFDMSLKGMGRVKMEQVARRRWKDGRVVNERFYYKG